MSVTWADENPDVPNPGSANSRSTFPFNDAIFATARRLHRAKLVRQPVVKLAVDPVQEIRGADVRVGRFLQPALDEHLHFDVGAAFELEGT